MDDVKIAMAATNSPELAPLSFTLGEREFKVVNLAYRDQCAFLAYLGPVLSEIFSQVRSGSGSMAVPEILSYCADKLPAMVQLVCKQTDPTVTVKWVEENAGSPMRLAKIVMLQANQNKFIDEVADFFAQILEAVEAFLPTRGQ